MKKVYLIALLAMFCLQSEASLSDTATIKLEPTQSMSISGKGPGQDAAINPYLGGKSKAFVENVGKKEFSVRIQRQGKIISQTAIPKGEQFEFELGEKDELYFDSDYYTKVKVWFEKN